MAINSKSSLKEVINDERAVAIINEYVPGFMDRAEEMGPVMGMKLSSLLKFPQVGMDRATVKELCAKIDALDE